MSHPVERQVENELQLSDHDNEESVLTSTKYHEEDASDKNEQQLKRSHLGGRNEVLRGLVLLELSPDPLL